MLHYDMLLLRYGEITVKGKNRTRFEKAAQNHVADVLKAFPATKVRIEYGRIYVVLNDEPAEPVIQALRNVFGITSISPVMVANTDIDDIISRAISFIRHMDIQEETTFKVNARRVWKKFPISSQDMNQIISGPVLEAFPNLKVDVRNPQVELRVEVREQAAYLFCQVVPAAGGFPRGTNGKAMLLLSGGIDSPVAGWQAMRRGLEIECVHFHSYPYTSKKAEEKVIDLARVLAGYYGQIKLHLVPFTEIQTTLAQSKHDNVMITLMRRAMMRITTLLAERNNALAIVTGDSLGQVASQTLASMNVIGRVTPLPILRPLVTTDKGDIITMAQKIGTYELSILPYEDCCTLFVPKSPSTNPNLRVIESVENSLPQLEQQIDTAVLETETIIIKPGQAVIRRGSKEPVAQDKWF